MEMSKKKAQLFRDITSEKEFENVLNHNTDKLIFAEIYSGFAGSCMALDRFFTRVKFEWSSGEVVLLKVLADAIEALARFHHQSAPVYMFIVNKRTTKVFRGVDAVKLGEVFKTELHHLKQTLVGVDEPRISYELSQPTPDEMEVIAALEAEQQREAGAAGARRAARQAVRKRRRAALMAPRLRHLAWVLYWPHAKHAHPELYERWNDNNIIMVGREEIQLTQEKALDVLYDGDADLNEAALHMLLSGPALAIAFRLLDEDKHFVSLVRKILYEEIPPLDETKPAKDQHPQMTAFEHYKSYSPSRQQIWHRRREDKIKRREQAMQQRARRLSEMQRLARQAIQDAIAAKKVAREGRKMELLKAGNLLALDELNAKPDDEVDIQVPEDLKDEFEEESSDVEDENEYFPPSGLLVPGFYAPPTDIAKVNGLAILFPKLVADHVSPQPEFLPPHVLVMLPMGTRRRAVESMAGHQSAIIHIFEICDGADTISVYYTVNRLGQGASYNYDRTSLKMGVFKATTPYDAVHIAYTVKQYESLDLSIHDDDLRLALMVSVEVDRTLLELMDLNPVYVSRDAATGEDDCAALFSVDYGDEYLNLYEDFE